MNSTSPKFTIDTLKPTDKNFIDTIAEWYFLEWNMPIESTIQRLSDLPNQDTIFHLIVTLEDKLIATGGLRNNVNILKVYSEFEKYKPWVASLYTQKEYRNAGLGQILLKSVEQTAKGIGLEQIYLYTFSAEGFYLKRGWTEIHTVDYRNQDTIVMHKSI